MTQRIEMDKPRGVDDDEMRPEYDFSGGVRGKYAERYGQHLGAIIVREEDGFISFCREFDIASQGDTAGEASENLEKALELSLECADESEVRRRRSTGE